MSHSFAALSARKGDPTSSPGGERIRCSRFSTAEGAKRKNISTFDDDNTQSALRFLLAYCDAVKGSTDPRNVPIRETLEYGLKKMLEAQYPNGAWPQRYDGHPKTAQDFPIKTAAYPKDYPRSWPKADYKGHYTFNDNTHHDCIDGTGKPQR